MDTEKPFNDLEYSIKQAGIILFAEKISKEDSEPVVLTFRKKGVTIKVCGLRGEGANAIEALHDVKRKLRLEYQVQPGNETEKI